MRVFDKWDDVRLKLAANAAVGGLAGHVPQIDDATISAGHFFRTASSTPDLASYEKCPPEQHAGSRLRLWRRGYQNERHGSDL